MRTILQQHTINLPVDLQTSRVGCLGPGARGKHSMYNQGSFIF